MNKISNRLRLVILSVLASIGISACSDSGLIEEPVTESEKSGSVEVSFSLGGDINMYEETMTRAELSDNDLFAVLISDESVNYVHAYGVFDGAHVNDLKVTLDKASTYRFDATLIKDGKNVLRHDDFTRTLEDGTEISDVQYYDPFYFYLSNLNKFLYGSSPDLYAQRVEEWIRLQGTEFYTTYSSAPVDRYYGIRSDFNPSDSNSFEIKMLRMSYGLSVTVKNLDSGDVLTMSDNDFSEQNTWISGSPDIIFTSDKPYNGNAEGEYVVYSVDADNLYDFWSNEIFNNQKSSLTKTFKLKLTGADGNEKALKENIQSFTMEFERLKNYDITIDLSDAEAN